LAGGAVLGLLGFAIATVQPRIFIRRPNGTVFAKPAWHSTRGVLDGQVWTIEYGASWSGRSWGFYSHARDTTANPLEFRGVRFDPAATEWTLESGRPKPPERIFAIATQAIRAGQFNENSNGRFFLAEAGFPFVAFRSLHDDVWIFRYRTGSNWSISISFPKQPLALGLAANIGVWGLTGALLVYGVWWVRRGRRQRLGLCESCGYDISVGEVAGCPECGWGRS
jgi:hypothetical protein